jgi:hypothetical protein
MMTVAKNKSVFTVNNVEYCVTRPTEMDKTLATKYHNRAYREAVESGAMLKAALDKALRAQGLWDDGKESELQQHMSVLAKCERSSKIKDVKFSEMVELAFASREAREKIKQLLVDRLVAESNTAEAQAENARIQYLLFLCLKGNGDGKQVYKNYQDFLNNASSEIVLEGYKHLNELLYETNEDLESKLPENEFLVKYKLGTYVTVGTSKVFRRLNKAGNLVDDDGRLINEEGFYVDEDGKRVDREGFRVDNDGEYLQVNAEFLDDEGKPVLV